MKDVEISLKTERELTEKEVEALEKVIAKCLNKIGLEWHLEIGM